MGWGWYTCPMHDGCLYTRECQPLMHDEKKLVSVEDAVTFHSGLSLHKRGHLLHDLMHCLPGLFFPSILDLSLSLKSICLN